MLSYTSRESRGEAGEAEFSILVESVIEAVEDVRVTAGQFPACIKVRATVTYLDSVTSPFFSGDAVWWYAKGIGVVKSQMPEGGSELQRAKIGNLELP
jgi:hypothetical protein